MSERLWMLVQPLIAALCLIGALSAWLLQMTGQYDYLPSVQAVVTASFVYPGLALSMTTNHLIVVARRPGALTTAEKVLVLGQFGLAGLLVITSLDPAALLLGFLLWPLLIIAAVSACFTMANTTIRVRRERRQPLDPRGRLDERVDDRSGSAGVPAINPVA